MKSRSIMISLVAGLALAGCGDKGNNATNSTAEAGGAPVSDISLAPGEWETTQETLGIDVKGGSGPVAEAMKQGKGRKMTFTHCITPEDIEKSHGGFMAAQKELKCSYDGYKMGGGTVSGSVACDMPTGNLTSTVNGTYTPESYDMTIASTMNGMPGGMTMVTKMRMTSKRIGDCPAGAEGEHKVDVD